MNELCEYGIQTEGSDIRAHVSVVNKTVYAFQTEAGIKAISDNDAPTRTATQPGVDGPTAEGWLVKPEWIDDIRALRFLSWPHWGEFTQDMTTSQKGDLAVRCVIDIMAAGRFPLWIEAGEATDKDVQISGVDILLCCKKRIQVKCDWRAGEKPLGTGNLFLQKAERNPLGYK